jgi:hypothetical protein
MYRGEALNQPPKQSRIKTMVVEHAGIFLIRFTKKKD